MRITTVPMYAAQRVIDELHIRDPKELQDIDLVAFARGAVVREEHLSGAEARLTLAGRKAVITISANIQNSHRKRFSVAHELGHLEMHRYKKHLLHCTQQDINWGVQSDRGLEQEANEFAAALLMPEQFFGYLCNQEVPSLDLVSQLANDFDVSLTAAALRYIHFCNEPCAVIFSQTGHVRWFKRSNTFADLQLFIAVHKPVNNNTLASQFYQEGRLSALSKRVKVGTWLTDSGFQRGATLVEHSLAMPAYEAVLTLIWVDDYLYENDW